MEPKILVKPTEKQYTALQQAFDYILKDGERTMKYYWHKIDGLVYMAFIIGLCCLAHYIEHL